MDEVSDFFDFSKPFQRVTIPGGYVNGRVVADSDVFDREIKKREEIGDSYAKLFRDAEQQQILQTTVGAPSVASKAMSHIGDLEDVDYDMPDSEPAPPVKEEALYIKYNFDTREDIDLPIMDSRTEILTAIEENPVVVLKGDTGCGKTTQVPQFILNEFYKRREHCNIVCTQPRRIAAISIANRVCNERDWELGTVVGYQVGLHAKQSEDTRLLYCTTGILLQKLISGKTMSNYTHIILDEVHERDQDMDFLLILVRRLLTTNSLNTKVVLMSATINPEEFSEYFKVNVKGTMMPAPILDVDTRRTYTVSEFYLCQLGRLNLKPELVNEPDVDNPSISDDMYNAAVKLVLVCEKIDEKNVNEEKRLLRPSVLIFLPGVNEIDRMEKALQRPELEQFKLKILRLHSLITPDEQQLVFRRPPDGYRKVILSTNIAESSITVPDVKYVIDFCLTKSLVTDTSTNLTSLQLSWASRSNCKQRAGRAGRVMNGRVFRLVSKYFYENVMIETGSPEMIRCPLENVVLKAKLLEMGPPHAILALAMTPPNLSDIRNTILTLKECGALFKTVNGRYEPFDGDLTFIGRVMSALPIDIRITRLIIFGYIFSVLEEAIIIAAGLNVKSIFYFPYNNVLSAFSQKVAWSDGSGSDLFAVLRAYKVWCQHIHQRNFDNDESETAWARRYYINTRSMKELHLLVSELKSRLANVGLKEITGAHRVKWTDKEKAVALKIAIAGAFYPNYFVRATSADQATQKEIYQVLGGRDPCTTVFLTGFDTKYIGQLYTESIKNLFRHCARSTKDIKVTFEAGSQKIFISFGANPDEEGAKSFDLVMAIPGRVRPEVYKAVKMRKLRSNLSFKVMRPQDAIAYAESLHVGTLFEGVWMPYKKPIQNADLYVIPSLHTQSVRGLVTHIDTCSKFFFRPLNEDDRLSEVERDLNAKYSDLSRFHDPSEISRGQMVAAAYEEGPNKRKFFRARVIDYERSKKGIAFRVMFIDYGNFDTVEMQNIRRLGTLTSRFKDLPPRVFECYLAEVQPSSINCPHGKWPEEAMVMMQNFVDRGILEAQIYSVVNGIASVVLKLGNDSFNQLLIEKGFAQYSEENYMSKMDHDLRMRKVEVLNALDDETATLEYLKRQEHEEEIIVEPPPPNKCHIKVDLRGPFSPLETQVYASTQVGKYKKINIEGQSVNSVLLDSDPQNSTEKLLVAACVTENPSRGEMVARSTTIMPNIPGFPALMALIFCPTVEMKRDASNSKYIGMLAGLGCDAENNPIFEEHDMVFNFDVEITAEDLEMINQFRYTMELLVHTAPGETVPQIDGNARKAIPQKIKSLMIGLLEKSRKRIEVQRSKKDNLWKQYEESDVLNVRNTFDPAIFPMHCGLRCYTETFERMQMLRMHCAELYRTGKHDVPIKPTLCQLCGETLETALQLRIHLLSQLHRDREHQIGYTK